MPKTILLVDDESDIINYLENFLRRFKISSIKTLSGEDALAVYDKDKVDFVFLDIEMKGINGFTVFEELKKRNPAVKVIMITGWSEQEYQDKARGLGAVDYITKPLDLSELKEKIHKYIL